MSFTIISSIFLLNIKLITSAYLNTESHSKLQFPERNVINKGVWIKDPKHMFFDPPNTTRDFIFSANSLDVESLLENNFDSFGNNGMQDSAGYFEYLGRSKREAIPGGKHLQDSVAECKGNDCIFKDSDEKSYIKSKLMTKLKPASVFNDYPYEVAILLDDNKFKGNNNRRKVKENEYIDNVISLNSNGETPKVEMDDLLNNEPETEILKQNDTIPKRSMKNEYERDVIKKIEITEDLDRGNFTTKIDRDIFDKDDRVWHQSVPDSTYKVNPKYPKVQLINERGLLKVLSMLTKTFKKIMKQHSDIRKIHSKLHNINDEVSKNIVEMTKKYQSIEEKYSYIVSVKEKMKEFEANMNLKEEYLKVKDREMAKNLLEFENQQKKFLAQQRQFYNIQKLMLAQNEKINIKQNLIAKTQSEISHRQNNFARILKKAKQIYIGSKFVNNKTSATTSKPIINTTEDSLKITHTTTSAPMTTESIKINLFSIPTLNKLENQDLQILKEKDKQSVDDLVYKYYFNNTFIDTLMKSKVLTTFTTSGENTEIARNAKNKRHDELDTTLLLPINMINRTGVSKLQRERRWIRHHHKSKAKLNKHVKNNKISNPEISDGKTNTVDRLFSKDKENPFLIMAKSFCNEIGHNRNDQMLKWCVEKSLRRLQIIESKMPIPFYPPAPIPKDLNNEVKTTEETTTVVTESTNSTSSSTTTSVSPGTMTSAPITNTPIVTETTQGNTVFFPDNDELEMNLKEFDLKPDMEGAVYFDGSLHASDLGLMETEEGRDGFSDIMPGLDSNSKVDVDPMTFALQARRRDSVQRINANILKKLRG